MEAITEKARELANLIKQSEPYRELQQVEARLALDPGAQDLLQEALQKQGMALEAQQSGRNMSPEEIQGLEQLQSQIQLNATLQSLQKAQQQLEQLLQEVNAIIAEELAPGTVQDHHPGRTSDA